MMKYRFLKFLRQDVACHRRRFLSTAAVRDLPALTKKPRTQIPKSHRKAMVVDYVTKFLAAYAIENFVVVKSSYCVAFVSLYRAINAGKFPGVENTKNQVGGSWYTIRAILQELQHDSKYKDSVVQPATQRNVTCAIKETVDSVTPFHTIDDAEDSGDLFENGVDDNGSYQKTVVMPIVTRTNGSNVKDDCGNHTMVNLGLNSRGDNTCDGADTRYLEIRKVLNEQGLVEKTSPDMTVMESATEDFKLYEKSELPFQRPGLSSKVCVEINNPSAQSPEFTMLRVPGPVNMKQQDDGSMLPAVDITNEASLVAWQRTEAYQISKLTEIQDCQVITDRTTITDNANVSPDIGSTNQGGVETRYSQMKLPKEVSGSGTIVSEFDRTSTLGVDNTETIRVGDTLKVVEKSSAVEVIKASETETSQFCANSSLPSDNVGGVDTQFGGDKNVSPTTSINDGRYSRGSITKETQEKETEETLWGNLKSMANRFINIWR
ncbi:hypothetical protein KSS87_006905 [Heliosperma pusillum]|nr:hypothetical protein KSS87_006905 [Heliosperma pusillum]